MDSWLVQKGAYTFDRRFFLGVVGVLCVLFVVAVISNGWGRHYYVSCPSDAIMPCRNPYYNNDGLGAFCEASDPALCALPRVLQPGESFGERPPWVVRNFGFIAGLLVVASFVANHFTHNRRYGLWKKLLSQQ